MAKHSFILLSGLHHGGWCWSKTVERLYALGHRAHAVTYTGVGDRRHLLHPSISIDTYVSDVMMMLEAEELSNVVLVGNSLSGRIISVVADRRPDLVSKLIYFDAAVPISGERLSELMPDYWERKMKTAVTIDGALCFMPTDPATMGITDPHQLAWVARRLSPVPVRIVDDPVALVNPICNGLPKVFLRCTAPVHTLNTPMVERARSYGWDIVDIPVGHDAMITAPEELADILIAHAG